MNPLLIPTIIVAALLFALGATAERRLSSKTTRYILLVLAGVMAVPAAAFDLFYTHLFDSAGWFYTLRSVPFTEVAVSGIGLLAGFVYSWSRPERLGERAVVPGIAAALLVIPFAKPLLTPLDMARLQDRCKDGICLQSTFSTCGPASAATILRSFGLNASERDLARAALTSTSGTESWYLARAIRTYGLDTRFIVKSAELSSLPAPSIAGVVLPGGGGHFIAVLTDSGTAVTLADPLVGRMVINKADLARQYQFTGFFLYVQGPVAR